MIEIGKSYRFAYPGAFTTLPEYTAHAGQVVTVLREIDEDMKDGEVEPMYDVRAEDGWTGHAYASELVTIEGEV